MLTIAQNNNMYTACFIALVLIPMCCFLIQSQEQFQNTFHLMDIWSSAPSHSFPLLNGSWVEMPNIPADQVAQLLPCERKWIEDNSIDKTCGKDQQSFSMFTAPLGHQGGHCGTTNFSSGLLPIWHPQLDPNKEPASVQLLRSLRGKIKCFVGDSRTYQIFDAFSHSLKRQALLHPDLQITVSPKGNSSVKVPVNETGASRSWWGGLKKIFEYSAKVGEWNMSESTTVRWYKHYVWSPWDISLMEDCDVITFNLALHYWGAEKGRNSHAYVDDVKAALDFLSNFTASKHGRVAIWRETLPQHFKTSAGLYSGDQPTGCGFPIKDTVKGTQGYNQKTLTEFAKVCECTTAVPGRDNYEGDGSDGTLCLAYDCTMDHTASNVSYQSVHSWEEQNQIAHSKSTTSNEPSRVYWWPLFDVFDIPSWHTSDGDCSHFCFIPQAYEMGWARLHDILNLE